MKYSAYASLKYVLNGLTKREKWMFAGTFVPFVIGYLIQCYTVEVWKMPVSNDQLMWEYLLVAFVAIWLMLLLTLTALSKERELREKDTTQSNITEK